MAKKKWMIMVYLAGNNNLVEEMVFALREIYRIGAREDFDVIVQFDTGGPPRRFHIEPNVEAGPEAGEQLEYIAKKVLATPKEGRVQIVREFVAAQLKESRKREDADLERLGVQVRDKRDLRPTREILREFVTYCFSKFDADRHMLILSGHGSGAVGDFLGGDTPTSRLGIRDLSYVFKALKKRIDVLGMDSCLMSMAEVAYEVREYVDFMVGAEGFERNTGWPYGRLLELLMARPEPLDLEPEDLAKVIVKDYVEYYENYTLADLSTDIAALNLRELDENLISKLNTLASMMETKIRQDRAVRDAILLSHWEAQSYKDEQYTDLWDFCDLLAQRCGVVNEHGDLVTDKGIDYDIAKASVAVRDAVYTDPPHGVVMLAGYCGAAFQHSHGLSVFFPWADIKDAEGTSDLAAYAKLEFSTSTYWNEFLKTYLRQTRRLPRDEGKKNPKLKKTSRLDQRPGIFTSLALQNRFAPPEDRFAPPEDRFAPPEDRFAPPEDRFAPPEDRFALARIGSMKNPPIDWYPSDIATEDSKKR